MSLTDSGFADHSRYGTFQWTFFKNWVLPSPEFHTKPFQNPIKPNSIILNSKVNNLLFSIALYGIILEIIFALELTVNPFHYGSIVIGKDFCGRESLIKELQQHIDSCQNVVTYGERRVGKTSLIFEAIQRKKTYRVLRLDLMNIKSIDTLCRKFLYALGTMEQESGFFERFIKSIPSLRPTLSLDPVTGMPMISLDSTVPLTESSLQEIFGLIKKAHKNKRLIVVIDEFQAMLDIKDSHSAIAELRAQVQHAPEIPFIFAGSIRHQMEEIFTSHDSPFFKAAIPLSVSPLSFSEFAPFLLKRFRSGKRIVSEEQMTNIFSLAGEITGDVQQFCEALWATTEPGDEIGQSHIGAAIELLISREVLSFQSILAKLTSNQVRVLSALAAIGGEKPTAKKFMKHADSRNASAVLKSLGRLAQIKIIYQTDQGWKFMNPVFRLYVLQYFP
ncbi:MAG: AAA family ATPase [Desulfuromonadaceae bacterium]|nr:AAA family ATPase [Desulfuromonadaceae bacterium]